MSVLTRSNMMNEPNPDHTYQGLKEKLKALTMLCEQHKQKHVPAATITKNPSLLRPQEQKNEPMPPQKENSVPEFSRPTAAARKLSLPAPEKKPGSKILVFVRVRPMSKKEKEAGSTMSLMKKKRHRDGLGQKKVTKCVWVHQLEC
ncbi:putative kinesin-like protein KIF19 isoform X1 [Sesbania bispinosa]|nr:putative kinesin-like protein KIF19 isoform X1 [Sesbania bispinosa]